MRLGILGGTFDPIHLGHLLLANEARDALELDSVWFVPASRPPHKSAPPSAGYDERLRMVELAIDAVPGFRAAALERDPSSPSFTVDTLRRIRDQVGADAELWLLLGSDSLRDLPTWREPEEIVKLARLAVYPRPGGAAPAAAAFWEARTIEGPRLDLSSTEVRARVAGGRSIRFLVPAAVRDHILARGLYGHTGEAD